MREPACGALPVAIGEPAEPQQVLRELSLRLVDGDLRVDLARPCVRRPPGDRPAHFHVEARALIRLRLLRSACVIGLDALRPDAVEEAGIRLARDVRLRGVRLHQLAQTQRVPRGDDAERVVLAVLESCAHDERIRVLHVDEMRAGAVARLGDRDDELTVRRGAADDERFALADAERRLDDRVRVARQLLCLEDSLVLHAAPAPTGLPRGRRRATRAR